MVKKAISYSLNSEKIAVTSTMESDFADLIKKRENVKIAAEDVALKKKNFAFLLIFLPFTKNKWEWSWKNIILLMSLITFLLKLYAYFHGSALGAPLVPLIAEFFKEIIAYFKT